MFKLLDEVNKYTPAHFYKLLIVINVMALNTKANARAILTANLMQLLNALYVLPLRSEGRVYFTLMNEAFSNDKFIYSHTAFKTFHNNFRTI